MIRFAALLTAPLALGFATPAAAQMMTTPANEMTLPPAIATTQAQPYLFAAGQSDVFEISASQVVLMRSQNAKVRDYAQQMIADHTKTTNAALEAAKIAGVTPPPPVLDADKRGMITTLLTVPAADFDRTFLDQQVPSHEKALAIVSGYARSGDQTAIRAAAAMAEPIVARHLMHAKDLRAGMM